MSRSSRFPLALVLLVVFLPPPASAADVVTGDPAKEEVSLPAKAGWTGTLILDNDVGVWTVGDIQAFPRYGCPEVFGLDDRGRCTILVSYSGKWTPFPTVQDGEWLGALQQVDLDRHVEGPEIYTGGKKGNLFQIVPHSEGDFDTRVIARFPGEEIHTMIAGDLLPGHAGNEMLVFSRLGLVWDIVPPEQPGGTFATPIIADLGGRVRQALLLPSRKGEAPWIAAAGRFGKVLLLRRTPKGLETRSVTEEPMGFGRIALKPGSTVDRAVLYATRDDGVVLRLEGSPDGEWKREVIYAGPQGLRGVAAGRFDADPEVETLAVFGYSKKVQLLSRPKGGAWKVETLFEEIDKGHWLATAELDGRNATDELIASGYGTRIFLLARPPGYGLKDAPTDPDEKRRVAAAEGRPVRVAVRAANPSAERVDPLSYRGGFVTKSLVYETLVRRDADGRIVPGLASAWRFEGDGRALILTIREGARFHDGHPVDAEAVRDHFERWLRLPEHAWLRSTDRVTSVRAISPREVRIETDRPTAVLPDLVAINPCAVRAPGALDGQGTFVRPLGTGPFRFDGVEGRTFRYRRAASPEQRVDLVAYDDDDEGEGEIVDALLSGDLDLAVDGWEEAIPRDRLKELAEEAGLSVTRGPGSSVRYLSFRFDGGPTADVDVRRRIARSIDRKALVDVVEGGLGTPCATYAAPTVVDWPPSSGVTPPEREVKVPPLRLLVEDVTADRRLAGAIAAQLSAAGLEISVVVANGSSLGEHLERGDYDLRLERTWGVPYDPYVSLAGRFLLPERTRTAATISFHGADPAISALVDQASRTPDPEALPAIYSRIQRLIDTNASLVPLYVPHRLAVARAGLEGVSLDHDLYHLDLSRVAPAAH